MREVRDIVGEGNPPVLRLLPNRSCWRWEVGVAESTDGNADMVWPQVGIPEHRRSACRAEVLSELSSLLPIADIDFGRPFGVNMLPLEVGTHAEHRAGSPLTLATMADAYNIRIGGYFDTQGTATAMRGSSHNAPPLSDAGRLQESGCQNDRLLSIVPLRSAWHRCPNLLAEDFAARRAAAVVALLNLIACSENNSRGSCSLGIPPDARWNPDRNAVEFGMGSVHLENLIS